MAVAVHMAAGGGEAASSIPDVTEARETEDRETEDQDENAASESER
jgi:hypothetical protein